MTKSLRNLDRVTLSCDLGATIGSLESVRQLMVEYSEESWTAMMKKIEDARGDLKQLMQDYYIAISKS